MANLNCIPNLSEEVMQKLHGINIRSTDALLFTAQTAGGVAELVAHTGLDSVHLTRLLAFAQLMRLPGVGCRMAQLFHKAEFGTVRAVAAVSPEALAQQLRDKVGVVLSTRKAEHIILAAHRLMRA